MMYIENIFLLLALPLLACLFCIQGRARLIVGAMFTGMVCCLLSAYVSSTIAGIVGADTVRSAVEVAPVVEEIMKLLPLLFLVVFITDDVEEVNLAFMLVAVGFATMESAFFLAGNGAEAPEVLAMRGLSTAIMHLVCGMILAFGLMRMWSQPYLRAAGTLGLLSLAIGYHGLYNLLIAAGGIAHAAAVVIPLVTLIVLLGVRHRERSRKKSFDLK